MKYKFSIVFIVIYLISSLLLNAQESKKLTITIDDLPTLSHDIIDSTEQLKYFNRILSTLDKYKVQATGFVVGKLIKRFNAHLIDEFIKRGHTIGNHTYSHWDLNSASCLSYELDIEKNEAMLSNYAISQKYFRYPMLHTGNIKAKRDSIHDYLIKKGFAIVPVTIDNDESAYNIQFVTAFYNENSIKMKEIGKQYVAHIIEKTIFYDSLSYKIANRPIKHVLLLHANFINSFYLDELLCWYRDNGWDFISLKEALSDPIYSFEEKYIGRKGLSWLERIVPN